MGRNAGRAAVLLGAPARCALASESNWTLLAVFRRSLYCMSPRGAVICLGHPSVGAGPLNVLADLPMDLDRQDWVAGTLLNRNGPVLDCAGRLAISLAKARVWRPATPPSHWDPAVLSRNLDALASHIGHAAAPIGLTWALPRLRTDPANSGVGTAWPWCLTQVAGPGMAALRTWLESATSAEATREDPPPAVASLLGLGPGLTPSGDDVLCGTLIALRALGWPDAADLLGRWILARARSRTHAISCAHLMCAAAGEGAEALHNTLVALCSPDSSRLGHCLETIGALGHSSGWDGLAGLALVAGAAMATGRTRPSCRVPSH